MKRITMMLCILLSALMLLTACHSTIPLDDSADTKNTQSDSTQPVDPGTSSDTQAQTERATSPDEKTTASERITEPLDIEDDEPARPITIEVAKLGEIVFEDDPPEDRQNVQFCDMKQFLVYGDYVIGKDMVFSINHQIINGQKYNTKTGVVSPLCIDPYCSHDTHALLSSSPEDACPFGLTSSFYFVWNNKVYYDRVYIIASGTPDWGTYHNVFASYDIATGEYKAIHDYSYPYNYTTAENMKTPSDKHSRWLLYGDHAYTLMYEPITTKPQSETDYRRMLVRLDLSTNKEENLFDVTDFLASGDSLTFIRKYVCYFINTNTGLMTMLDMKTGEVTTVSISKNVADGPIARQGFGLCEEWFYCLYSPNKNSVPTYFERINLLTGKHERLSDAIFDDLIGMDDRYIYLGLAARNFQEENPWIDITYPQQDQEHEGKVIVRFSLDMQEMKVLGNSRMGIGVVTEKGIVGQTFFFDFGTGITYLTGDGVTQENVIAFQDDEFLQRMEALGYR